MIAKLFDYYRQKNSSKPIKLGMSIMVRDEEDIIEKNIRFHATMGVEQFFVVNNASVDNTRDIIESLKTEYDIQLIDNPDKQGYRQEEWMTKMVTLAKQTDCDWLINNDADEFWMPDNQESILPYLNRQDAVLQIDRFNMQNYEGLESIFDSEYLSFRPVEYDFSHTDFPNDYINVNLAPCLYKVMTNIHGLLKIRGGNHAAKHIADTLKRRRFTRHCRDITIYHYPIRSFEQFKKRLLIIKQIGDAGNLSQMGGSARYWYQAAKTGQIEAAYEQLIFNEHDIQAFIKTNIFRKTTMPKHLLGKIGLT